MDWKDSFNPRTLSAGWQIYQHHGVDQILRDHHIYFARVQDAWVEAQIEDGEIVTVSCTCPRAQAGMLCPHEAAFLFALEDCPDLSRIPVAKSDRTAEQPEEREPQKKEQAAPSSSRTAVQSPIERFLQALEESLNETDKTEKPEETTKEADVKTADAAEAPAKEEVLQADEDVCDYMEEVPKSEGIEEETVEPSSAAESHSAPETEKEADRSDQPNDSSEAIEADEDVHDRITSDAHEGSISEEIVEPAKEPEEQDKAIVSESKSPADADEKTPEPAVQAYPAAREETASAEETEPSSLPVQTKSRTDSDFHFGEITLEAVLNALNESELRALLLKLCRQSEDSENVVLAYAPESVQEEALDLLRQKLEQQLVAILSCRHFSRRQAPGVLDSFLRSLQMSADQLEKQNNGKGVALLLDLAGTAEDNMVCAQLGLLETFLEEDFRMVRTWVPSLNRENLTSLFSWTELHLEQNDLPHLRKELEDLLEKSNFNTAQLAERKLQVMVNLLEEEKKNGRERGARTRHLYEVILNLYEEFPALLEDTAVWKSFLKDYGQNPGFRILEADRAMADHRTREGEDLLCSLDREQMTMNEEKHFNHLLLETFKEKNNAHEMRRLLKHMVSQRGMSTAEDLALLQQLESPEEFEEDFLNAKKNARKKDLFTFCTDQKLYDRLLELLEEDPSIHDLSALSLPESGMDNERLAKIWLTAAEQELLEAHEAESYTRAVSALNQAARLGLKDEAAAKADTWKKKYPHRLSLLSELRSSGY